MRANENKWAKPQGCSCEDCPLQEQPFCPHELHDNARCVWIGMDPSGRAILNGRPFEGADGNRLKRDARIAKLKMGDANIGHAVACRSLKKMTDSQWTQALK